MSTGAESPVTVPAKAGRRGGVGLYLVVYAGIASSILALLGIYFLEIHSADFNIMGWYADYVIPAGAIIVGLVAASGYGIASWFTGVKINKALLLVVLGLQVLVYFAAQYVEFRHLVSLHPRLGALSFFRYYDLMARAFAWKHQNDSGTGEPLGIWGYFFRVLEILGFLIGSLIVPIALLKAPYCQACQRYMNRRQLSTIAASVPIVKIKKKDTEAAAAHAAEQRQAFERGKRIAEILQKMSVEGQAEQFRQTLAELEPEKKKAIRLPQRLKLHLIFCKQCRAGSLQLKLLTGQGKQLKQVDVGANEVKSDFVSAILP